MTDDEFRDGVIKLISLIETLSPAQRKELMKILLNAKEFAAEVAENL
jgi:hypothetical protein